MAMEYANSPATESSSSSDNSSTRMTSSSKDLSDDASYPSREPCGDPVEADDQTSPMNQQLPIRRGLSKFYQGKSQSYQSLSDVKNIEDLPKKVMPLGGKMKQSRSYAGGLDGCSSMPSSGPSYGCGNSTITNKGSISMRMGSGGAVGRCKLPPVPAAHKNVF